MKQLEDAYFHISSLWCSHNEDIVICSFPYRDQSRGRLPWLSIWGKTTNPIMPLPLGAMSVALRVLQCLMGFVVPPQQLELPSPGLFPRTGLALLLI